MASNNPHLICLHEERWETIRSELKEIRALSQSTHDRLFMGNGTPAVVVRLDRVERIAGALVAVVSSVAIALMIAAIIYVAKRVTEGQA